jgi:sulfide:quinone oxidoreductase
MAQAQIATFEQNLARKPKRVEVKFDMIHVVPPQMAPDFMSGPARWQNDSGFVDVDPATLRHSKICQYFCARRCLQRALMPKRWRRRANRLQLSLSTPWPHSHGKPPVADYDGYGSCPLTVERGKVVLAEFGYGGKLLPSFPELADRRHETVAAVLAAQRHDPAAGLLAWHAQGPRMDGQAAPYRRGIR